jgi:hypothetical protein
MYDVCMEWNVGILGAMQSFFLFDLLVSSVILDVFGSMSDVMLLSLQVRAVCMYFYLQCIYTYISCLNQQSGRRTAI